MSTLIKGLVEKLPTPGEVFPPERRNAWFELARIIFDVEYGPNSETASTVQEVASLKPIQRSRTTALPAPSLSPELFEIRQRQAPLKRGERRTCDQCKRALGCTSFKKGSTTCRSCMKDFHSARVSKRATTPESDAPKRKTFAQRTCDVCKETRGNRAFIDNSTTCRRCDKSVDRALTSPGRDVLRPTAHTPRDKQEPGTLSENGNYVLTRDEYNNHKNGSTAMLYARLWSLIRDTRIDTVTLYSITGYRVETITREEIMEGSA